MRRHGKRGQQLRQQRDILVERVIAESMTKAREKRIIAESIQFAERKPDVREWVSQPIELRGPTGFIILGDGSPLSY